MLRTVFVQGSLINYDWSICHIDAINQIIPRPVHPSYRAHCCQFTPHARHTAAIVDLLFVVTITKQTLSLTIDPTNCSVMVTTFHCHRISITCVWSVIGQHAGILVSYWLMSWGHRVTVTMHITLPLATDNWGPLIGQLRASMASDLSVVSSYGL